jgi:hypothetical protein
MAGQYLLAKAIARETAIPADAAEIGQTRRLANASSRGARASRVPGRHGETIGSDLRAADWGAAPPSTPPAVEAQQGMSDDFGAWASRVRFVAWRVASLDRT